MPLFARSLRHARSPYTLQHSGSLKTGYPRKRAPAVSLSGLHSRGLAEGDDDVVLFHLAADTNTSQREIWGVGPESSPLIEPQVHPEYRPNILHVDGSFSRHSGRVTSLRSVLAGGYEHMQGDTGREHPQ